MCFTAVSWNSFHTASAYEGHSLQSRGVSLKSGVKVNCIWLSKIYRDYFSTAGEIFHIMMRTHTASMILLWTFHAYWKHSACLADNAAAHRGTSQTLECYFSFSKNVNFFFFFFFSIFSFTEFVQANFKPTGPRFPWLIIIVTIPPGRTQQSAAMAAFLTADAPVDVCVWAAAELRWPQPALKLDVGSAPGGWRLSDASARWNIDSESWSTLGQQAAFGQCMHKECKSSTPASVHRAAQLKHLTSGEVWASATPARLPGATHAGASLRWGFPSTSLDHSQTVLQSDSCAMSTPDQHIMVMKFRSNSTDVPLSDKVETHSAPEPPMHMFNNSPKPKEKEKHHVLCLLLLLSSSPTMAAI